jgi:uncharacterized protein (DUF427 family)
MWANRGHSRPDFAIEPGSGQESVWDYPRPPAIEPDARRVIVKAGDALLAETTRAIRILETASPPGYYIPPEDVRQELLRPESAQTFCEWKGVASYWSVTAEPERGPVAWSYVAPNSQYAQIERYFSFYPGRVECYVGDERVRPQPGGFYGGWITDEIVGPWKGEPGTGGW